MSMQICSSQPLSVITDAMVISTSKPWADWSDANEEKLINILLDHKANASDLATIKPAVWNAASQHLKQFWKKRWTKDSCCGFPLYFIIYAHYQTPSLESQC